MSRKTWVLISVPISGLPLSWPVPIMGWVVLYTTYYLIGRSPILGRRAEHGLLPFGRGTVPGVLAYGGLGTVSRGYPPPQGRLTTCY
jgi:hypothetical protein